MSPQYSTKTSESQWHTHIQTSISWSKWMRSSSVVWHQEASNSSDCVLVVTLVVWLVDVSYHEGIPSWEKLVPISIYRHVVRCKMTPNKILRANYTPPPLNFNLKWTLLLKLLKTVTRWAVPDSGTVCFKGVNLSNLAKFYPCSLWMGDELAWTPATDRARATLCLHSSIRNSGPSA